MKTDLYTKTILTIIAFCLAFNVIRDLEIIPAAKADDSAPADLPIASLLNAPTLRTNSDGSINVRLAAADVIEVKPAWGATFDVRPYSSSTTFYVAPSSSSSFKVEPKSTSTLFKVEPASSYTRFTVEPYSSSSFKVEPKNSNTKFTVEPDYYAKFQVTPASNAVFSVKNVGTTSYSVIEETPLSPAYPNPATDFLTISYSTNNSNEQMIIYDMNGQTVDYLQLNPAYNQVQLDVSGYPSGTYIYTYTGQSGKFIKK